MGRPIAEILKELADEVRINNEGLKNRQSPNHDPLPAALKEILIDINIHLLSDEPSKMISSYLLCKLACECENTKFMMVFEEGKLLFKENWMSNDLEATVLGAIWYMCH